jgi:acyl-CoA synthetase (AMP-forming)/AMP-acid ligase II
MIVSGGENVYPVEVENALLDHPAIADAAVIGVPDPRWGEAVLAMIVPAFGHALTTDEVTAFCRDRIAGYKCPREFRFIDMVPRNAAGKILRRELRALLGRPGKTGRMKDGDDVRQNSPLEAAGTR